MPACDCDGPVPALLTQPQSPHLPAHSPPPGCSQATVASAQSDMEAARAEVAAALVAQRAELAALRAGEAAALDAAKGELGTALEEAVGRLQADVAARLEEERAGAAAALEGLRAEVTGRLVESDNAAAADRKATEARLAAAEEALAGLQGGELAAVQEQVCKRGGGVCPRPTAAAGGPQGVAQDLLVKKGPGPHVSLGTGTDAASPRPTPTPHSAHPPTPHRPPSCLRTWPPPAPSPTRPRRRRRRRRAGWTDWRRTPRR